MRPSVIALAAMMIAAPAAAQRPGAPYSAPGAAPAVTTNAPTAARSRWSNSVDGRWAAASAAPGGWAAYRRPDRGWALPPYWLAPRFTVGDWQGYGLPSPQAGYRWVRYYDDAVLVDRNGSVRDSVARIDWEGRMRPAVAARTVPVPRGAGYTRAYRADAPIAPDYASPYPGYDEPGYGDDPYPPAPYGYPGPDVPPPGYRGGTESWTSPDGRTTVTTSSVGGAPGYVADGYYYPGASSTTVTVQSAPAVTTTTTTSERVAPGRARKTKYIAPARSKYIVKNRAR